MSWSLRLLPLVCSLCVALPAAETGHDPAPVSDQSPAVSQQSLVEGNARFVAAARTRSAETSNDADERKALAGGQHPFAAILTCADSRLSPELIFDQSIGDLFVVRNAGNIAEPVGEGSLEYAIEHLGVHLVVVMGHASCGAVKAVISTDAALPGHLVDIQANMPGLFAFAERARKVGTPALEVIQAAVEQNAEAQARALVAESPLLKEALVAGRITVVPAVYALDTGVVTFHPAISDK